MHASSESEIRNNCYLKTKPVEFCEKYLPLKLFITMSLNTEVIINSNSIPFTLPIMSRLF